MPMKIIKLYFNNDSLQLVAPHKLLTMAQLEALKKKLIKDALLHKIYHLAALLLSSSYIWILDENYIPKTINVCSSMQMNAA
jgi:ABC-type transport system involved in cytochrome c biogenesis ATPase subunit